MLERRSTKSKRSISLSAYISRLIGICMLPLLLLSGWLAFDDVRQKQADMEIAGRRLAESFMNSVDDHLLTRIGALQALTMSPLLDDASRWPAFYQRAQSFHHTFGSHVVLADTGTPMRMLFNTRAPFGTDLPPLPQPDGHAAAPTAIQTGKPAVGDTFFGPLAREPLVAVAVPVLRDGKAALVLLTILEVRQFQRILEKMAPAGGWSLCLIDGRGKTIAGNVQPERNAGEAGRRAAARTVANSTVSAWSAVIEIPADAFRKPLAEAAAALALAIIGAALIGFLGGRSAGRKLGRAVASLSETFLPDGQIPDIREIKAARGRIDAEAQKRAAAEAGLRASEERLRLFVEHAPVALAMFDREMRYLSFSRRWVADYQLGDREIMGRSHYEIFPEIQENWRAAHRRGLAGEVVEADEDAFVRSDGTVHWARWEVRPWYASDGAIGGIIIFTEDISERKRAEEKLREAEANYHQIVETANEGIWAMDGQYRTTFVNRRMTEMLGYAPEEMIGRRVDAFMFTDDLRDHDAKMAAREKGRSGVYERRFRCKDGRQIWTIVSATALKDADGNFAGSFAMFTDITQRKNAEEGLRTSELNLKTLFDAIDQSVFLCERDGTLLAVNRTFAARLGQRVEDCVGRSVFDLVPPDIAAGRRAAVQKVIDSRRSQVFEDQRDGRWMNHNIWPILDAAGEVERLVVFATDITERKLAEETLEHSRQMLQGYAAHLQEIIENERLRIARELHDDIGQRLSALKMDLGWVKRRLPPDRPDAAGKLEEMRAFITEGVQTVKAICADLRPGLLEELGLQAALEWAAARFQERSGVRTSLKIDDSKLSVDAGLSIAIYRIAQEALTNISRHAAAGRAEIRLRRELNWLILEVEDDGKGVPGHLQGTPQSFGIIGMRERVRSFGGEFNLSAGRERGTIIRARFPLPPPEESAELH